MSSEFQERLQLYRDGKLGEEKAREVEKEIDKFMAISEYLNCDEKSFLEDLKQETVPAGEPGKKARYLKRKVNLRIITMSLLSAFSALVILVFLYMAAGSAFNSLFAMKTQGFNGKRYAMKQLLQIFQPEYEITGIGMSNSLFAKQEVSVSFAKRIGNTRADEGKLSVKFSFGKPVLPTRGTFPNLLSHKDFYALNGYEGPKMMGFEDLEEAPQGTKAKVLVDFSKALTPKEVGQLFQGQGGAMEVIPLAATGTNLVLANPSYFANKPFISDEILEYNVKMQDKYYKMDNQAHRESFIGNLNTIRDNRKLLEAMYNRNILAGKNIDHMIKYVEDNGIQYVGAYITGDSKKLLKFKDNPLIHSLSVEDIVVW